MKNIEIYAFITLIHYSPFQLKKLKEEVFVVSLFMKQASERIVLKATKLLPSRPMFL